MSAVSSMLTLAPNPAKSTGYGLYMLCVNTKVLNPKALNTVLLVDDPGATCSLLPGAAESVFLTAMVKRPVVLTDAFTLGTPPDVTGALIAVASPVTVLLGAAGTATSMLLTRRVWPVVNTGLATVAVIVPYTLLWFTLRCTLPAFHSCVLSCGAPIYKLQLKLQMSRAWPKLVNSVTVSLTIC